MREIKLTQGKVALVDDEDFEAVSQFKWYATVKDGRIYYACRKTTINGQRIIIHMHRLLMGLDKGCAKVIDHIDGNGLNNQKCNLRICTIQQNCQNRKSQKNNTSGYKGVSFDKQYLKWKARICAKDKRTVIGYYVNKEQAALAYNEAAKKHYGEFASLNQIPA